LRGLLQTNEEIGKVFAKLNELICLLPGHSEVSQTGSTLREGLEAFPLDMENKLHHPILQSLILLIHPAL
jgi:hypothetical protein